METSTALVGALNVNVLDERGLFLRSAEPVHYFSESLEQRRARRMGMWMPVELRC
jgi:hypothetical protein